MKKNIITIILFCVIISMFNSWIVCASETPYVIIEIMKITSSTTAKLNVHNTSESCPANIMIATLDYLNNEIFRSNILYINSFEILTVPITIPPVGTFKILVYSAPVGSTSFSVTDTNTYQRIDVPSANVKISSGNYINYDFNLKLYNQGISGMFDVIIKNQYGTIMQTYTSTFIERQSYESIIFLEVPSKIIVEVYTTFNGVRKLTDKRNFSNISGIIYK
jgi:hypothetical protein